MIDPFDDDPTAEEETIDDRIDDIVAWVDEVLEMLRAQRRGLICKRHGRNRHDTRCPICALVTCRQRSGVKGKFF